jgi:hypothetical protein
MTKMPERHRLTDQPLQERSPSAFELEDLVPYRTFDVVELEQSRRHGTSSG